MKNGDIVRTWFDTGAFGVSILHGVVEKAGPVTFTVVWRSGIRNRVRRDCPGGITLETDPDLLADARKRLGLPDAAQPETTETTMPTPSDVRWEGELPLPDGEIQRWWYRVSIIDGQVLTEHRCDPHEPWKRFSRSGFGSNVREQVLEQALLASGPTAARKRRASTTSTP